MQYSLWFKKEIPADVVIPPFFIANLVHFCCSHFFLVKLPRVFSILLVLTSSFWIYQFFLLFPFCFLRHLFQLLPLLISLHSFICCCCHFYLLRLVLKFWGGEPSLIIKAGVSNLLHVSQIGPTVCYCTTWQLRIIFTLLKHYQKKKKKTNSVTETIWPTKPTKPQPITEKLS